MSGTRFDVSAVPPQGGYVAKQCPVRAQWDVLRPAEPLPEPPLARRRMDAGIVFEAEVFARLARLHPDAVVVPRGGAGDRADREEATVTAMADGAPLVIGGRLPTDATGRRVGEPDLLVAAGDGGYRPVDVKHHRTLSDGDGVGALVADLRAPGLEHADHAGHRRAGKHKGDLFQLAHYHRLLQACGRAATGSWGGIVGTELVVTWYDLDRRIWQTPSVSRGRAHRSTLDVYDFEFGFRLDIIAVAARHRQDPTTPLLVVPVRSTECQACPWGAHCRAVLEERRDVSLLPRVAWRSWRSHRDQGVHSIDDLARLDHRTAQLAADGVDLAALQGALDAHPPTAPVADVIGRRKWGQLRTLAAAGVETVADARVLDARVAGYSGSALKRLPEEIDLARARLAPDPVLRRRGLDRIEVPRADVEVDLDLESTDAGVYLWGTLVSDRTASGVATEGYRAFATWAADPAETEVETFEQLCDWLAGLRDATHRRGLTFAVHCYNEQAEAGAMRRLAAASPDAEVRSAWVEELVTSSDWVDLYAVADRHVVTGAGMGLKVLAAAAGFAWEDEDPGGEQSMSWHHLAVTSPSEDERDANRRRILTYNRNDVEATRVLRDWMEHEGPLLPSLDALDRASGW